MIAITHTSVTFLPDPPRLRIAHGGHVHEFCGPVAVRLWERAKAAPVLTDFVTAVFEDEKNAHDAIETRFHQDHPS